MKIQPVKGTRDFYPQDMAVRNWLIDGWKRVSVRNGFEEYDGPIFEYLKMFQIKSGDEIAEQLFSFEDRGGRNLALRPEITPTLARMINKKINSLPRPIKWFSVPRLFRAEKPQKGRLREFFQWNIDIIGEDSVLADAEVIFTTVDYLREIGLKPTDIKIKYSSRKLLNAVLKKIGISEEKMNPLYTLLDKRSKLPSDVFSATLKEQVGNKKSEQIIDFMNSEKVRDIPSIEKGDDADIALSEIEQCESHLRNMDIFEYCAFDPSIVRGLAYYTGIVFEVHDIAGELRAIGGGGRFDNLLHDFGGPKISATGMGMGDCVLSILLEEKGLLQKQLSMSGPEYFVAFTNEPYLQKAIEITAKLRLAKFAANFSYKPIGLSKQLKQASEQKAKKCIIIGSEIESGQLVIKDMATGKQEIVRVEQFLTQIES